MERLQEDTWGAGVKRAKCRRKRGDPMGRVSVKRKEDVQWKRHQERERLSRGKGTTERSISAMR